METKAFIRVPIVYNTYSDSVDIEIDTIISIGRIVAAKNEKAGCVIRTKKKDFDSSLERDDVINAVNLAYETFNNQSKPMFIIVDASTCNVL